MPVVLIVIGLGNFKVTYLMTLYGVQQLLEQPSRPCTCMSGIEQTVTSWDNSLAKEMPFFLYLSVM